jgi:dihydrofolate synthase/folylpolyglutamate synthase
MNTRIHTLLQSLLQGAHIDLSLSRIETLLAALGNPQHQLPPVIHLAGTNGKGSTLAFLRAIYTAAGYRVHAYTSPHLVRFNERIMVAGCDISDDQLLPLLEAVAPLIKKNPATFFEATTAVALLAFARSPADILLLETGLGGRLDATNVVPSPLATVITPIDFDHMDFLGDTIEKIAAEKAGIIKANVPCFTGAQRPQAAAVLASVAAQKSAPLLAHSEYWTYDAHPHALHVSAGDQSYRLPLPGLLGAHQHHNAALASVVAMGCAQRLPIAMDAIATGIRTANWPARLQHLRRGPIVACWGDAVYLDGGHNASAAQTLAHWLAALPHPVTLVCGMMARKDAEAFLTPLAPHVAQFIAVPVVGEGDAHPPEHLAAIARKLGIARVSACHDVRELPILLSQQKIASPLLIAGSLFLAGELLKNHG